MLKFVSWIDSLPRLANRRRNHQNQNQNDNQQNQKRRFEKTKAKSTTTTPLVRHKEDKNGSKKLKKLTTNHDVEIRSSRFENSSTKLENLNSAFRAIGRRRHTEPDAFRRTNSPLRVLSPIVFVSKIDDRHQTDPKMMSVSWHPEGLDRVQSFNVNAKKIDREKKLISSSVSCSVQEISSSEIGNYNSSSNHRSQIRTNPWVRPKSPRIVPVLDLSSRDESKIETSKNVEAINGKTKDDRSVYSLRSSSGYGSGCGSQDSSPASSVHTPDWQHLNQLRNSNDKNNKSVALQCDLTEDKSVNCTEEDFLQYLQKDENGNIRMIDDDESEMSDESDEDEHVCDARCNPRRVFAKNNSRISDPDSNSDIRIKHPDSDSDLDLDYMDYPDLDKDLGYPDSDNKDRETKISSQVLNVLHAKVELLKVSGDQVTRAVRSAKEEQRKRNGELRVYEEQMQFLKQLKLVISSGFEVIV